MARSRRWLEAGAVPVLVEGPIDALAVTLAGDGQYVGVAPLGTALTDDQARQLATSVPNRSSPPTPTSLAASPPNAPSGSSANTAPTRSPSTFPKGPTPPQSSTPTAQTHSSNSSKTLAPSDRS
jgi:hypothetical protein